MKLSAIAALVGGKLQGADLEIEGLCDLSEQRPGTLAFADSKRNLEKLKNTAAGALLVPAGLECAEKPCVVVDDVRMAMIRILETFSPYKPYPVGVSPRAFVADTAVIGKNVTILPNATVMDHATVGDNSVIYPGAFIGKNAKIGADCVIKAGAVIDEGVELHDRVIVHHNAVIGGDGFGYLQKDGVSFKVPQIGKIIVKNDVEIGACTTVDRAAIGETVIGEGVKIDNLVQIAHNVNIGDHSILVSQVGVAGSSSIGKFCIIAGQAGIADHVKIGDKVVLMARTSIESNGNIEPGRVLFGTPARDIMEEKRIIIALGKLPEMIKTVRELSKKVNGE